MKTRRTTTPVVCEACETRRALRPQPERIPKDQFQLCRICSDRAERLSLRPLEWYNLAKRHGPHGELLGREYYSPGGIALMGRDELEEEPHLLPAPILQDVAHDLPLLWDHTLTRRQLKPKLLAAWRRHPKAAVAAHLIQIWESRQEDHARETLLTLCRDILGRAGAELARRAWKDYHHYLQFPPLVTEEVEYYDDTMDFSKLLEDNLEAYDDADYDDDRDSSPALKRTPNRRVEVHVRHFEWHGYLPSVSARCLPHEEAYQLAVVEVERSGHTRWFSPLHDPRVLDWIETHIQPPLTGKWGGLAATSSFSWGRALRWIQQGRPLSHAALDALSALISLRDPDEWDEEDRGDRGVRLLDPPSRRTLSRVLKAHALRDPVPRVENTVAFILEHAPVLLEGKPYRG
jgi:hypothetical protein